LKPQYASYAARSTPGAPENGAHAVMVIVPPVADGRLFGLVAGRLGEAAADDLLRLPARRRPGHAASRLALQRALRSAGPLDASPSPWRSLAHSGRAGLAVVAPTPVGADLEPEARFDATFASRIADDYETGLVREAGIAGEHVPAAVWTAKEAALKATGRGLRVHPRNARIVNRIDGGWLIHVTDRRCGDSDWDVATLRLHGWRLAVARSVGPVPGVVTC
jgi:phosphopantetheinyl transferase (holo-ACP synthase)